VKIIVSYRREDSGGDAGRLYAGLSARFGNQAVFIDVDTIEPGDDVREAIQRVVASSDAVLVLIGAGWFADTSGRSRLAENSDFVRLEISSALKKEVPVIPILLPGASMPRRRDLPVDLAGLADCDPVSLRDAHWHADLGELIERLDESSQAK
jgi:hypothetical protein